MLDILVALAVGIVGLFVVLSVFSNLNAKKTPTKKSVPGAKGKAKKESNVAETKHDLLPQKKQPKQKKQVAEVAEADLAAVEEAESKYRQSGMAAEKFHIIKLEDQEKKLVEKRDSQAVRATFTQKQKEREEALGFQIVTNRQPVVKKNKDKSVEALAKAQFDKKLSQFFKSSGGDRRKKYEEEEVVQSNGGGKVVMKAALSSASAPWGAISE